MTDETETPEYWTRRADEARAMAVQLLDPKARLALLEIARGYEKMALRAQSKVKPLT